MYPMRYSGHTYTKQFWVVCLKLNLAGHLHFYLLVWPHLREAALPRHPWAETCAGTHNPQQLADLPGLAGPKGAVVFLKTKPFPMKI